MPRRPANRDERDIAAAQLDATTPVQETPARASRSGRAAATPGSSATPSTANLTGVVGDASAAGTRSGEDTRRRGWFWHWNSIVTQYAPMIGLKGVGLVNSYTVWTDRRESSPHRGYAFPSQQREADFYGEDRAELITINKILVTLDLIEIRKEMVQRTDERGRRWKVPHNFYRVKDHDDGFSLTARDVLRVAELADSDRAVYRYLRRMFSPKFAPIDSQNVWHEILPEVRATAVWQRLAERTAKEESKASARSRAGHAARRGNDDEAVFSLPTDGDNVESEATATDTTNDSPGVATVETDLDQETSVASTNTGLETTVERDNTGFGDSGPGTVLPTNTGRATSVAPTNRTYHQDKTTTTTREMAVDGVMRSAGLSADDTPGEAGHDRVASSVEDRGPGNVPDQGRAEDRAIRRFEEANARVSTPAERRLLRQLADQFDNAADQSGTSGWDWLGEAIDDAVSAGSAFVAPRRIREILTRWERDGAPGEVVDRGEVIVSQRSDKPVTRSGRRSHSAPAVTSVPNTQSGSGTGSADVVDAGTAFEAPVFTIETCGMTSRQVWAAVLSDLQVTGEIGRADVATWLRDAAVLELTPSGNLVVGVPHDLARRRATGRYGATLVRALERVTGVVFGIEVVLFREWAA